MTDNTPSLYSKPFFVDDAGNTMLAKSLSSASPSPKGDIDTGPTGSVEMPLDAFLGLLVNFPSLEDARVVSLETHRRRSNGLRLGLGSFHRVLVAHMRREGHTDAWLRLDHQRSQHVSQGVSRKKTGVRATEGTVSVAELKEALFAKGSAIPENRLEFDRMPTLGVLILFLTKVYEGFSAWPGNSVGFCGLLQKHLAQTYSGRYTLGRALAFKLPSEVRECVEDLLYCRPLRPPNTAECIIAFRDAYGLRHQGRPVDALRLAQKYHTNEHPTDAEIIVLGEAIMKELRTAILWARLNNATAYQLINHVVGLYRKLWWDSPTAHASDFAAALKFQREQLTKGENLGAACWSALDLVVLRRDSALIGGTDADGAKHTSLLADALTEYGNCLAQMQRYEETVTATLEAVQIWGGQPLHARDMRLVDALGTLSDNLVRVDRIEDARAHARGAVDILYSHYHSPNNSSDAMRQHVARKLIPALVTCANFYPASDSQHNSTLFQAADVARREMSGSPSPTTQQKQQLADILASLADSLSSSGEHRSACTAISEMVTIQRALDAASEASVYWITRRHTYPYLRTYASYCTRAGLHSDAVEALREYKDVCRAVYNRGWRTARQLLEAVALLACALVRAGNRAEEAGEALLDGANVCQKAWAVNPKASTKLLGDLFERYAGEFRALGARAANDGQEDIWKEVDMALETLTRHIGEIDGSFNESPYEKDPMEVGGNGCG